MILTNISHLHGKKAYFSPYDTDNSTTIYLNYQEELLQMIKKRCLELMFSEQNEAYLMLFPPGLLNLYGKYSRKVFKNQSHNRKI